MGSRRYGNVFVVTAVVSAAVVISWCAAGVAATGIAASHPDVQRHLEYNNRKHREPRSSSMPSVITGCPAIADKNGDPCPGNCMRNCSCNERCFDPGCLDGFFGPKCDSLCACGQGVGCYRGNGSCICDTMPGRRLVNGTCEECPEGQYGLNCLGRCNCSAGLTCDKNDGQCLCEDQDTMCSTAATPMPVVSSAISPTTSVQCSLQQNCPSGAVCRNGRCMPEGTQESSSPMTTIIIAACAAVAVLLVIFILVVCLVLRRVRALPKTQNHIHLHGSVSCNDVAGLTKLPSRTYIHGGKPAQNGNGVWLESKPGEYSELQKQEPPAYTPLLKLPNSPPPTGSDFTPIGGRKAELVQTPIGGSKAELEESDNGAAYATSEITKPEEEPCYRILQLEPIKDTPPPVAPKKKKPKDIGTLPNGTQMGYAQLEKDKPLLQASRSMSVSALSGSAKKDRAMRPGQMVPLRSTDRNKSMPDVSPSKTKKQRPFSEEAL